MKGNIQVIDQTQTTGAPVDTVGILMVPMQDLQSHVADLENREFNVQNMQNFQDLRGGQSGTGDEQTLIVWTVSSPTMDLSSVTSNLQKFLPIVVKFTSIFECLLTSIKCKDGILKVNEDEFRSLSCDKIHHSSNLSTILDFDMYD
jgi:hypothetical protein